MTTRDPMPETGIAAGAATKVRNDLRPHAGRAGWWYVAEHELRRVRSWWTTFVSTTVGTPLLYLLAFGVGLASLIGGGSGKIDGVPYVQFVIPAFLCAAAVNAAVDEYMFGVLLGFMWNKGYEAMHAAPISPAQIVIGHLVYTTIRVAATAVVYLAIAMIFGAIPLGAGFGILPVAILTALAFGLPVGLFSSTITEDKGQFNIVMRVIVLPLTLFSGTVFPLDRMPLALQWIGWLSPLWHGTQLSRDLSYGQAEPGWLIAVHVLVLLVVPAVFLALIVRVTRRRLTG